MSEYGLFFDSRNGDRKYNAASMEEWLKPFFVTGVFNGELQVVSDGGMAIVVDPGYCNINGKVRCFESENHFTLATASGLYDRVDTVVIERNDADREITMKVVQGGSDGQPVAPVREFGVYQLVLAQILVARGATEITQSAITDTRMNTALCGWVASTVDEIDFDQAYEQFTTWFNEYKEEIIDDFSEAGEMAQEIFNAWFQHMKGQLDTDAAGHLQLELDNQAEMIAEAYSVVKLYNVGDYVTYENKLYECTSAVTTYGDFNPSKWTEIQVQPQIDDLTEAVNNVVPQVDGFESGTTVFNQDGSITTTYSDRVKHTVFNANGSITETLTKTGALTPYMTKNTVFNTDGSITETVS